MSDKAVQRQVDQDAAQAAVKVLEAGAPTEAVQAVQELKRSAGMHPALLWKLNNAQEKGKHPAAMGAAEKAVDSVNNIVTQERVLEGMASVEERAIDTALDARAFQARDAQGIDPN